MLTAYKLQDRLFQFLRIGDTIELRSPFMVPRVKSYAYGNASNSVPSGQFLSGVV